MTRSTSPNLAGYEARLANGGFGGMRAVAAAAFVAAFEADQRLAWKAALAWMAGAQPKEHTP